MKKIVTITLLIVLLSIYFSLNNRIWYRFDNSKVKNHDLPIDSLQNYFPKRSFNDLFNSRIGVFKNDWYSNVLYRFEEPILYRSADKREIYRLTWLRSFRPSVMIRLEHYKNLDILIWKIEVEGYYKTKFRILNKHDYIGFKKQLKKTYFWRMWTVIPSLGNYMDGSEWILEGSDESFYHVVNRWSPDDTRFKDCCLFLIGLADIKD